MRSLLCFFWNLYFFFTFLFPTFYRGVLFFIVASRRRPPSSRRSSHTQHHTSNITHSTSHTRHHTLNITHSTSHTISHIQHHTITHPTSHTRYHTLKLTLTFRHPISHIQHHTLDITNPTSHTQHHTRKITHTHTRHYTLDITHPLSHTQHPHTSETLIGKSKRQQRFHWKSWLVLVSYWGGTLVGLQNCRSARNGTTKLQIIIKIPILTTKNDIFVTTPPLKFSLRKTKWFRSCNNKMWGAQCSSTCLLQYNYVSTPFLNVFYFIQREVHFSISCQNLRTCSC